MATRRKAVSQDENAAAALDGLEQGNTLQARYTTTVRRRIEEQDSLIFELEEKLQTAEATKKSELQALQDKHTKEIEPMRIKLASNEGKLKAAAIALGDPKN